MLKTDTERYNLNLCHWLDKITGFLSGNISWKDTPSLFSPLQVNHTKKNLFYKRKNPAETKTSAKDITINPASQCTHFYFFGLLDPENILFKDEHFVHYDKCVGRTECDDETSVEKIWQNLQISDEPERKLDETWEHFRMRKKAKICCSVVVYVLSRMYGNVANIMGRFRW